MEVLTAYRVDLERLDEWSIRQYCQRLRRKSVTSMLRKVTLSVSVSLLTLTITIDGRSFVLGEV